MDLINSGTDPWILEYDSCEKVAREIMEDLNARGNDKISSQLYSALSGKIRIRLRQYSTEVSELGRKLSLASVVNSITPEERERRRRQVEALQSKEVQLRDLFNQRKSNDLQSLTNNENRSKLFEKRGRSSVFADEGVMGWGDGGNTSQEPDGKTIEEMKQEQEKLLKEQNEGLESLLKIVTAQNQMATSINNEVEHHNDILVDISDGMERVDGKMNRATDIIKIVGKKDSIWGYWLVAFLLFIAILGVALA